MNKSCIFYISPEGNIFDGRNQAIVCPVNCYGVMGKGLALQFKHKYPDMYVQYKNVCIKRRLFVGDTMLWINDDGKQPEYIILFPTKLHWRMKSEYRYIQSGLKALKRTIQNLEIISIGVPALGCGLGGLDFDNVLEMIQDELYDLQNIKITIYAPKEKGTWEKVNC